MNRQQALSLIQEDLIEIELRGALAESSCPSRLPSLAVQCTSILEAVCSKSEQELQCINFKDISRFTQLDNELDSIYIIRYITGARFRLFDVIFIFKDESTEVEIPTKLIEQADIDGYLLHPITNNPVEDYKDKTYLCFRISNEGKELLTEIDAG